LNEAKEIETEFDPEILEAEKKLAVESENIEAVFSYSKKVF